MTSFSATESVLGYLYQIQYSLMSILEQSNDDTRLLIEVLDDFSIQNNSNSLELYQTKLHTKKATNLTDKSPEFWKTLRVWSEGITNNTFNIEICQFNLITTSSVSNTSTLHSLKEENISQRDISKVRNELLKIADTSENKYIKKAYNSFKKLSEEGQNSLLRKIIILDNSLNINEIEKKIKDELRYSSRNRDALYERLVGWFYEQIILQLQSLRDFISLEEVRLKILDISDCLKLDNLPNDFSQPYTDREDMLVPFRHRNFTKQLDLIKVSPRLINHAISDYIRAFNQKSRWIRDGLIQASDEIEYHMKLQDNWDKKFSTITEDTSAEQEINSGRVFYETHYVKTSPQIYIKDRFREEYMICGCCHQLSDKLQIGWHPRYKDLIR